MGQMTEDNTIKAEWVDKGNVGDRHRRMLHEPCGTTVFVLIGRTPVCPECQPDEWSRQQTERLRK
jgi:hypothetical protein